MLVLPLRGYLQRPLSHRERGDHLNRPRSRRAGRYQRRESGWFEDTATHPQRLLKIGGANVRPHVWKGFLNRSGLVASRSRIITIAGIRPNLADLS
jgi:hypothetical protein